MKIAEQYGIEEAILLNYIAFWVQKNAANEQNYHDGRYWTYNSLKALSKLFPYMNERKIRYALDKLKNAGLILSGNFGTDLRNRTLWYSLTDEAIEMLNLQNCHIACDKIVTSDTTKLETACDKNVKCNSNNIYINNTTTVNNKQLDTQLKDVAADGKGEELAINKEAVGLWSNSLGLPSAILAEKITALVEECGIVAYRKALDKALERNKRSFAYVQAVARGIAAGDEWESKPPAAPAGIGAGRAAERKKNDVAAAAAVVQRALEGGGVIDL
ncbi:MAG: hypothetical protein DBY32_03945 [Phascolarctobacterium sp.]|nr:MAG: hypothetical protein DBY32_03945 [Phascolarctobacterium sp.]